MSSSDISILLPKSANTSSVTFVSFGEVSVWKSAGETLSSLTSFETANKSFHLTSSISFTSMFHDLSLMN